MSHSPLRASAAFPPASSSADELEQIPVLPDWDYVSRDASQRAARRAEERRLRHEAGSGESLARTTSSSQYLMSWSRYVSLFLGAGLISGSVVHYPLDPGRYLLIGAAGAALFAVASAFHEARSKLNGPIELLRFIVASLVLALGIGMISGGIQHFSDIPDRAATLIPLGGALSLLAFAVRDGYRLQRSHLRRLVGVVAGVLLVLALVLGQIASGMKPPVEGGDHHGSATTETPVEPTTATTGSGSASAKKSSATVDEPAPATTTSVAGEHADDGHGHAAATVE